MWATWSWLEHVTEATGRRPAGFHALRLPGEPCAVGPFVYAGHSCHTVGQEVRVRTPRALLVIPPVSTKKTQARLDLRSGLMIN
mmetsp:Transcript_13988/g.50907  ORF Transcript_13988/g.50907 Transcript_13988/m.50907 type:complete len:84 (-) Transcript_13988:3416-3667(-)